MKIAIIGAGNVGSALGKRLAEAGHKVVYGLRNPADPKYAGLKDYNNSSVTSVKESAQMGNFVFITVPWSAAQDTIHECGDLSGKVVVDCTNPIKPGSFDFEFNGESSAAEHIQEWAPNAKVVKCFNHMSSKTMENPEFNNQRATAFVAGNDTDAVKQVAELANNIGLDSLEIPDLQAARQLEQMAKLWISLAYKHGKGPGFAYSIIER